MANNASQLASFLKLSAANNKNRFMPLRPQPPPEPEEKPPENNPVLNFSENPSSITDDDAFEGGNSAEIKQIRTLIDFKMQQLIHLKEELRILKQIQNNQEKVYDEITKDRRDLERQVTQNQTGIAAINNFSYQDDSQYYRNQQQSNLSNRQGPQMAMSGTPYFLQNSTFLRAFLRKDKAALDDLVRSISPISDQNIHGLVITTLFQQMQKFMQLNNFFERLSEDSGTDNFISTFENNIRNLIDCRRIILWAHIPSAHVIVSHSAAMFVPEGEGLLGKAISEGQRIVVTDPTRDPSYSINYDAPLVSTARSCLYQPVVNSKKETLWIIQIIDRLNTKGNIVTPSGDDFLILDFLSLSLIKLYQEESQIDEMIKRILTESTRSLLTERQVLPLLETVQLTVTRIVGCESLQIFFADSTNNELFQLRENQNATHSNEMNISTVQRENLGVEESGIAGIAYKTKKVVNVAVAKEYSGYNANVDGQFPNGAVIAVPLLSSKGIVSLVAVARQKKNGIMFTESDEIILEALSRISQGALSNAQSHERNIAEIQKALDNQKYHTALLTVAQELSAVLDVDTLVRKIMTKAQSFIGADRCSLFLIDKVRGDLWSMVAHGATDRIHIPLGFGIAGHVAATGETLNIPDAYKDSRFNSDVDKSTGYRTRSILCVPINDGNGNVIGCTQMINKLGASEFSSTDVELMTAFNVFCGIALNNAQLFEAATQSKKKMTAMLDIALSLSTSMTLDAIVTNIMKQACELIEAEHVYLLFNDFNNHTCKLIATSAETTPAFSSKSNAISFVMITGRELNLNDPYRDKHFKVSYTEQTGVELKNMLLIPVIDASGQIVGVVAAINKKGIPDFTEEDQSLLRAFASFAGLALEQWLSKRPIEYGSTQTKLIEQLSSIELTSFELTDRMRIFDPLIGIVQSNQFNVFEYQTNDQYRILIHFFDQLELLTSFQITLGTLLRFIDAVHKKYLNVPFHNFSYAVDATQFVFYELKEGQLTKYFSKVDLLVLLVACLCHDLGFSISQNAFNEQAQIPLSVLYKEQPVLETFHCSEIIRVVARPSCNILANLDSVQLQDFWMSLMDCILAADVSQYSKILEKAEMILNKAKGPFDLKVMQNKNLLLKILVQCAIHANVIRDFDPEMPWCTLICSEALPELKSKGEESVNPLTDIAIAEGQVKCIETTYLPLFRILGRAVEALQPLKENLELNLYEWKNIVNPSEDYVPTRKKPQEPQNEEEEEKAEDVAADDEEHSQGFDQSDKNVANE